MGAHLQQSDDCAINERALNTWFELEKRITLFNNHKKGSACYGPAFLLDRKFTLPIYDVTLLNVS